MRTVEISKGGTPFFSLSHFHRAFPFIDSLIEQYRKIAGSDRPALAYKLAEILDTVNYLHPFREGNTRTVAVFAIKYFRSLGYKVMGDAFERNSLYFRDALVRACHPIRQKENITA